MKKTMLKCRLLRLFSSSAIVLGLLFISAVIGCKQKTDQPAAADKAALTELNIGGMAKSGKDIKSVMDFGKTEKDSVNVTFSTDPANAEVIFSPGLQNVQPNSNKPPVKKGDWTLSKGKNELKITVKNGKASASYTAVLVYEPPVVQEVKLTSLKIAGNAPSEGIKPAMTFPQVQTAAVTVEYKVEPADAVAAFTPKLTDGKWELKEGDNVLTITVSKDGAKAEYTAKINYKKQVGKVSLKKLTIGTESKTEADIKTEMQFAEVNVKEVEVKTDTEPAGADVAFVPELKNKKWELKEGANTLKITVSKDGAKTEYTAKINYKKPQINITGIFVDNKKVTKLEETLDIGTNRPTIMITVPSGVKYKSVKIDNMEADYKPASGSGDASYSKTLTGLKLNTEKDVTITITDDGFSNSPVTKKLKLRYTYKGVDIHSIKINGNDKTFTGETIDGKVVDIAGEIPLILNIQLEGKAPTEQEKLKVTYGGKTEEKTYKNTTALSFKFEEPKTGEQPVKIETIKDSTVLKTINFKVKFIKEPPKVIKVARILINGKQYSSEPETLQNTSIEKIEKKDFSEEIILPEDKNDIDIVAVIATDNVTATVKTDKQSSVALDKTGVEYKKNITYKGSNTEGEKVTITIKKDGGYPDVVYTFTVRRKIVDVKKVVIGDKTYNNWKEFAETTQPIDVNSAKINIEVEWANTETMKEVSLKKTGEGTNLFPAVAAGTKKATASDIQLTTVETEFTLKLAIDGFDPRTKTFKVKKTAASDVSEETDSPKAEWFKDNSPRFAFAEDANTVHLYVKPKAPDQVANVKLIQPAEADFTKVTEAGTYKDWYKAVVKVDSNFHDKAISYKIIGTDGTLGDEKFYKESSTSLKRYLIGGAIAHNSSKFQVKRGNYKCSFDNSISAEINAAGLKADNVYYIRIPAIESNDCKMGTITITNATHTQDGAKTPSGDYQIYIYKITFDSNLRDTGGVSTLEIPIMYKDNEIFKYTVKINVPKKN